MQNSLELPALARESALALVPALATVAAKSKKLDAEGEGKGISESAILDNQETRAYYK